MNLSVTAATIPGQPIAIDIKDFRFIASRCEKRLVVMAVNMLMGFYYSKYEIQQKKFTIRCGDRSNYLQPSAGAT